MGKQEEKRERQSFALRLWSSAARFSGSVNAALSGINRSPDGSASEKAAVLKLKAALEALGAVPEYDEEDGSIVSPGSGILGDLEALISAKALADFEPPAAIPGQKVQVWQIGDKCRITEDGYKIFQMLKGDLQVVDVRRHGGNAEGRGGRIFLTVKSSKGGESTIPASFAQR